MAIQYSFFELFAGNLSFFFGYNERPLRLGLAPLHFREITIEKEVEECSNHGDSGKAPDLISLPFRR